MQNRIQMLDCTLRDGCYIVRGNFGAGAIRGLISMLQAAGADLIECGWLKAQPYTEGSAFFRYPSDLEQYLTAKDPGRTYLAMIDMYRYPIDELPPCDGKSIDAIRVTFPENRLDQGMSVGKKVSERGYQLFFQAANTVSYSDESLKRLAEAVNASDAVSLGVVNTYGSMYAEDLERIVPILDQYLDPRIRLGFHSHNNLQLAFALSARFLDLLSGTKRQIFVDASLCGMGRGAGNTCTELLAAYLNSRYGGCYDLDVILDAIDTYIGYFAEHFSWGYSPLTFVAGLNGSHVSNLMNLRANHQTGAKQMHRIIRSLPQEDRWRYCPDLLESRFQADCAEQEGL